MIIPLNAGVHYNVPAFLYHDPGITSIPALNASMAQKLVEEGPARAWVWREKPEGDEKTEERIQQVLDLGSAAHVAILEPDLLSHKVVLIKAKSYGTKEAREQRDEARDEGKYPLLPSNFAKLPDLVKAMRNELTTKFRTAPDSVQGAFEGGHAEVTLIAGGDNGHPWVKARPDYVKIVGDRHWIYDYKTTGYNAGRMEREARRRWWKGRAALYSYVYFKITGVVPSYRFIVQEVTKYPYMVYAWEPTPIGLKEGELEVREAIEIYSKCMATGEWPSDVEGLRYLDDDSDIGELIT